jgi:hypothetical protein
MINEIVGIVGKRGEGKSTMMRRILEACGNMILIDTLGEHDWAGEPLRGDIASQIEQLSTVKRARIIPDPKNTEAHVNFICRACFLLEGTTLAIDEVDWYAGQYGIIEGLNSVIQYGRHAGINLVWCARTPTAVGAKLRSETDKLIAFKIVEPRWLESLEERFGSQVYQLPNLKNHTWKILQ